MTNIHNQLVTSFGTGTDVPEKDEGGRRRLKHVMEGDGEDRRRGKQITQCGDL